MLEINASIFRLQIFFVEQFSRAKQANLKSLQFTLFRFTTCSNTQLADFI